MQLILKQFNRIEEVAREVEVLKRDGTDHRVNKGCVQKVIDMYHPKSIQCKIVDIIEESKTTKTIRLSPVNGYLPPFQAGQYINVFVEVDGITTSRPYSISSSPNQIGYYDITVRRVKDGFVSNYLLDEAKIGDTFKTTAPSGFFYYNPVVHGNKLVLIAGGSGITPFISMIRYMAERAADKRQVELVYGCISANDVLFESELNRIQKICPNFKWHLVVSEPKKGYKGLTGFITAELLTNILADAKNRQYFLCGPGAMYQFCVQELVRMGISVHDIKQEVQCNPTDPTKLAGWPEGVTHNSAFKVTVNGIRTIEVKATETLMNSLERNGVVIPASCRSGECSLCRTKLVSGKVFYPDTVKLRYADRKFGYIHPCSTYPASDLTIQI